MDTETSLADLKERRITQVKEAMRHFLSDIKGMTAQQVFDVFEPTINHVLGFNCTYRMGRRVLKILAREGELRVLRRKKAKNYENIYYQPL